MHHTRKGPHVSTSLKHRARLQFSKFLVVNCAPKSIVKFVTTNLTLLTRLLLLMFPSLNLRIVISLKHLTSFVL